MSMSRQVALIAVACGLSFQATAHFHMVDPEVENVIDAVTADQTTLSPEMQHFQDAISRSAEAEAQKKGERAAAKQRKEEGGEHVKEELEKRKEGEKAREEHLKEVTEHRDAAQRERLEKLRVAKEEQARMQSRHDATVADIKDEQEQLMQEHTDRRAQALREKQEREAQKKLQIAQRHQQYLEAQAAAEERRARSRMEFEVQAKILADARALREEVEQLPLPATRGRRASDKGTLGNMTAMVQALTTISNDDRQRRQWKAIAYNRLQPQIARYVVGMKYLVAKLVNESASQEEDEFMQSLEDFMNDTKDLLDLHQQQARTFASSLEAAMSRSARRGLEPIMSLVATEESPFTPEAALTNTSKKAACKLLMSFVASASPYYVNLEKAYQALNATAQLLPHRLNKTADAPKAKEVAIAMVELAYAETLGLREASYEVASKLGPVLSTRFRCEFSAAAPVGGLLAAALAVALHLLI